MSEVNTLASAKRKRNERAGIHAWHPYYAGYSEKFVDSAIHYLKLPATAVVLDPWSGSGTTQLVCAKRGIHAIGFDVNPVMVHFSNAKFNSVSPETLHRLSAELQKRLADCICAQDNDPLLDWMSPSLCSYMRSTYETLYSLDFPKIDTISLFSCLSEECSIHFDRSFFVSAMFILGRELAGYGSGSNPTWTKVSDRRDEYTVSEFVHRFVSKCETMLDDIRSLNLAHIANIAALGDSRSLPIRGASIDGIITSPPYLTRIDYAMSTKPELLLLGDEDHLRRTRELTMGAPVIVNKDIQPQPSWGPSANRIIEAVGNHKTKAAKSYYLPNILQYFRDADMSINEIIRVLKPDARALIVVQSSYFKEVEINLGEIYVEMATLRGCKSGITSRDVVRGHMAHVNTKSSKYKSEKVYYEDVVEIQNPGGHQ